LPREGPGSSQSTQRASCVRNLPPKPLILEVGCGPGAQTVQLEELCKGEISAVDNRAIFLEQLRQRAAERSLSHVIHPILADMTRLQFENSFFDMIWAEGSIFIIGVEKRLKEWRPLLKEEGSIAFSELSWLRADIPLELSQF